MSDQKPETKPEDKPADKPADKPTETPAAKEPFATFPTAEAFQERVAREAAKKLAELSGSKDPEELKKKLARAEQLEKEEEERKKAAMSEVERAKTEAAEAASKAAAAEARAEAAEREREDVLAMAEVGVSNTTYGRFLLAQERAKTPKGEAFDAKAALAELLKDANHAAALKPTAKADPKNTPANTSTDTSRDQPPKLNGDGQPKDVKAMTPAEFAEHKRKLGLDM